MAGQNHHFVQYAPEKVPYATERYVKETNRLYGVLDRRLAGCEFTAGDAYTIADIAAYPWIVPWKRQQQDLDSLPNLRRGSTRCGSALPRSAPMPRASRTRPAVTEEGKKILFGQTAQTTQLSV
jgi:GST-like protein